jgi:hypothetical protein
MFLKLDAVISVVPDSHGQPHGDPVRAFTEQIAAVDQITVDVLGGAVAQSALKARVGLTWTHQREHFRDDTPVRHEIPGHARAGGAEHSVWVAATVILSAEIDIDPQLLTELEAHRDVDYEAAARLIERVIDDRAGNRQSESVPANRYWDGLRS